MSDDFPVLDSEAVLSDGRVLVNVHSAERCAGRACVVHRRTDHHMREWLLDWSNRDRMFIRWCGHSWPHPDPDQREFFQESGRMTIHQCDGCCQGPA